MIGLSRIHRRWSVPGCRFRSSLATPAILFLTITLTSVAHGQCPDEFRRGDSNIDGNADLSDGVYVLNYLFTGGPPPRCFDAADINDTGDINISDPVYLFAFLFSGGRAIPRPGPDNCGLDPTDDLLDCAFYDTCLPAGKCDDSMCCPEGFYCAREMGDCDGLGECREKPEICPDVWDPVCGCDGKTYGNDCEAAAAGVNIRHRGECGIETCRDNTQCDPGSYCAKASEDCDGIGACEERPGGCPEIWDPVCGCDNRTYGNACEAASAGVNVLHRGECEIDTCRENGQCDRSQYCAKLDGDCDGIGSCETRPLGCPDVWDPVCGCDGRTYGNKCEAATVGVNVLHEGECKVDTCRDNSECSEREYCAKANEDCDGIGMCEDKPQICPLVWAPVCGCDGRTYGNDCEAAAAGVNVLHEGECKPDTCRDNSQCGEGEYCDKADEDCDGIGECLERPLACPRNLDPVCGCDGETYGNPCMAAAAGVNVLHRGECDPKPEPCRDNSQCAPDSYCAKASEDCDGIGECVKRPEACLMIWDPVCGCDGKTYGNACVAAAGGVNVLHRGECKEPDR